MTIITISQVVNAKKFLTLHIVVSDACLVSVMSNNKVKRSCSYNFVLYLIRVSHYAETHDTKLQAWSVSYTHAKRHVVSRWHTACVYHMKE